MNYYEQIINRDNPLPRRPLLTAIQADARIEELEAELTTAYQMIAVLKAVIAEQRMVIAAAAWRFCDE